MQIVNFAARRPFLVGNAIAAFSIVTSLMVSKVAWDRGFRPNLQDAKRCRPFLWSLAPVSVSSTLIVGGLASALHPLGKGFTAAYSLPVIAGAIGLIYGLAADDKETFRLALWVTAIATGVGFSITASRVVADCARTLYYHKGAATITIAPTVISLILRVTGDMADIAAQQLFGLRGKLSYGISGSLLGLLMTVGPVALWTRSGLRVW
jgi:hypothetical protein